MDILVTDSLAREAVDWLAERHAVAYRPELAADVQALAAALTNTRVWIASARTRVDRALLKQSHSLQIVARQGASTENIDLMACAEKGVQVVTARQPQAQSNAEFLLGALIMQLRGVPQYLAHAGSRNGQIKASELNGKTVGLLGLSITGRALATLLHGFGVKVLGHDPTRNGSDPRWDKLSITHVSLEDLFAQSDAVSIQLEYGSAYQSVIDKKVLVHARPGMAIVCISRSSVFDVSHLAKALRTGRVGSCWLDNMDQAHAAADSPLRGIESLVVTPRMAGRSVELQARASWQLVQTIDEFLSAHPPGQPIDQRATGRWFSDSRPGIDSKPGPDSRPSPLEAAMPAAAAEVDPALARTQELAPARIPPHGGVQVEENPLMFSGRGASSLRRSARPEPGGAASSAGNGFSDNPLLQSSRAN